MAKFIELTVSTSHECAELVADVMWNFTDLGVAVSDIQDVIDLEKTGISRCFDDKCIYPFFRLQW